MAIIPEVRRKWQMNLMGRRGFSVLELMVVVAIILIMVAVAIPGYLRILQTYRVRSDADSIMGLITVARMRAASDFARTVVQCDTTTNTCTLSAKQFTAGTPSWPTTASEPQKVVLSQGITFAIPSGVGVGVGGQSGTPTQGNSGQSNPFKIYFNSRGQPIKDSDGTAVPDYALYLKDSKYNYSAAVAIDISGRTLVYSFSGSNYWTVLE